VGEAVDGRRTKSAEVDAVMCKVKVTGSDVTVVVVVVVADERRRWRTAVGASCIGGVLTSQCAEMLLMLILLLLLNPVKQRAERLRLRHTNTTVSIRHNLNMRA